jgi:hypothetical protein
MGACTVAVAQIQAMTDNDRFKSGRTSVHGLKSFILKKNELHHVIYKQLLDSSIYRCIKVMLYKTVHARSHCANFT